MAKRDWQLFIPGWNIIHAFWRWRRLERAEKWRLEKAAKLEAEMRLIKSEIRACNDGCLWHLTDGRSDASSASAYGDMIIRLTTRHFEDLLWELKRPA